MNNFSKLEYLEINFPSSGYIDLRLLPKLELLNITHGITLVNLNEANSLKDILLYDFKVDSLPELGKNIERVEIYNSSITSLNALSNCNKIKKLELENLRKLESIEGIENSIEKLEGLRLSKCRSISDYNILRKLSNLKYLYLLKCPDMSDTSYLSNLKNLEYGNIDINILDGEVDLLLEMPIIFKNHKHFNKKNTLKIRSGGIGKRNVLLRGKEILYEL